MLPAGPPKEEVVTEGDTTENNGLMHEEEPSVCCWDDQESVVKGDAFSLGISSTLKLFFLLISKDYSNFFLHPSI